MELDVFKILHNSVSFQKSSPVATDNAQSVLWAISWRNYIPFNPYPINVLKKKLNYFTEIAKGEDS